MMKKCEQCGRNYDAWNSAQRYCSRECWGESQWKEHPLHTCDFCGDTFRRPEYRFKKGTKRYCSTKCSNHGSVKNHKRLETKIRKYKCEYCGKECESYARLRPERRFCSISCSNKARWEKKKNEKA